MKKCPYCAEEIQDAAIKCRFCGEWFEKQEKVLNEVHPQKNHSEDVIYCRKEAEQGDAISQDRLLEMHMSAKGIPPEYAEAAEKWYRKAAEQGHADAQYRLGFMYGLGEGVPQDYAEAVKWYRKGAEQGDTSSKNRLGEIYFDGKGVPQDYAEAVKWFRNAADQGDVWSCRRLGWMYEEGIGVPKDDIEAAKWFRKAVEQGDRGCPVSLDQMKDKGEYIDTDLDSSTRILSEVKDDSNLLQQDQTSENDSVHTLDLTETIGSEENVMQTVVLDGGITYHGQLVDGEPSGYGILTHPSGSKYEGQHYKGNFNGNGTKTFSDGMILSCKWRDGNPIEDAVTMIFPGGDKYIGAIKDFKDNEFKGFKGYGTYYHDGSQISAYWDGTETIGKVTWIHPDKSKYEGELKNFKSHGKGVLITDDGGKYEGDFVDGLPHGYGTVTTPDGKITSSGFFKNGKFIGKIKPQFK